MSKLFRERERVMEGEVVSCNQISLMFYVVFEQGIRVTLITIILLLITPSSKTNFMA